jgi:hypothetical protein
VEQLKEQVSAGEYEIDSGRLAGTIISNLALIRRVGRHLMAEDEEAGADEAGQGTQPRSRRRARSVRPIQAPRERHS